MTRNLIDIRKLIDRYVGIPLLFCLRILNISGNRQNPTPAPDHKVRNVLVIYISGVGDTVMLASCLKHLRNHYPNAEISFLASSQNYEVIKASPHLSRVFCLDKTKGRCCFVKTLVNCLKAFRKTGYDVIIDFEQFLRLSAAICLLSRAKVTIGFNTHNQHRASAYTYTSKFEPSTHTLDNFVALLGLLGIEEKVDGLEEIYVCQEDKSWVSRLIDECNLSKEDMVVGIHPGSGGTAMSRRWEPEKFGSIADLIIDHYGAKIVFTGTNDEMGLIDYIVNHTKNKESCLNLAGKVSLAQLPCLIKQCHVFLSNDTGPAHIAAAMETPVVVLFGPNTPLRYGPVGSGHTAIYKSLPCSPCIIAHEGIVPHCENNRCMKNISVEEVWKALDMVLAVEARRPHYLQP